MLSSQASFTYSAMRNGRRWTNRPVAASCATNEPGCPSDSASLQNLNPE